MNKVDIIKRYLEKNDPNYYDSTNKGYLIAKVKKQFENNKNPWILREHVYYTQDQIDFYHEQSELWQAARTEYMEYKPMKNNVIPRNFTRIIAQQLTESSGGRKGDIWHVFRNDSGLLGLNTTTGKYYYMFAANLRNQNYFTFLNVEGR